MGRKVHPFYNYNTMNRDGSLLAIWQTDVDTYIPANTWNKDTLYDAIIVGGGITGLTTALLLQENGYKCLLVEAHEIAYGTSGGTTAHLNTILDTPYYDIEKRFGNTVAKLVAQGTKEAISLIESNTLKYGIKCDFSCRYAQLFAQDPGQDKILEKILQSTQRQGIPAKEVKAIDVPVPFTSAVEVAEQAVIHPAKYLMGLARAFEAQGGTILQHCRVSELQGDDIAVAITTLGNIKARNVVWATHLPPGLNIFSLKCPPYRSYAIAFTLADGMYPDRLVYDLEEPYHYYRTQQIGDKRYIIAGGADHKTGHQPNTEYVFTQLLAYIKRYFNVGEVAWQWSSQYYDSADGLPYIGKMPGKENVFVATGFIGNGMVYGALSGRIISDLIRHVDSPYTDCFDPGRMKLFAGFSKMVKENADVVTQLISKRVNIEDIEELAEIAHGEGRVVNWKEDKVAIYKDEQGQVYALDPVCPHAKCIVEWNTAEKSWDCPCHGARYAANGDLLCGPAPRGLSVIIQKPADGD